MPLAKFAKIRYMRKISVLQYDKSIQYPILESAISHQGFVAVIQIRIKISPIRDCWSTPRNSLILKVTWHQTRKNVENLSGKNLDIVLEYHNSTLVFWLYAYQRRRQTLKSAIFLTFTRSWPWPWIRSYGILWRISHRPLPTYQITF